MNPQPQGRSLRPSTPPAYRPEVERWAVLVGISEYQHEPWNLRYAHADALALQALLQSPSHGGFDTAHMRCLTNQGATTRAITSALRTFLQDAKPDDLVLLYFACHGGVAFDGKNILYLYTYDTDPTDIPGTALRMDEIELALRDYIVAERVIVIADTCHAGGIRGGPPTRAARDDSALLNEYLKDISKSRGGVSMLTSALASQTSQEGPQWCDEQFEGHGVFTHFLLKGMAGEADGFPHALKDGKVTLGELFDYVSHHVQQAARQSGSQQTPWCSEQIVRDLLMAVTGGGDARGQCELGSRLLDLGWRISDPGRFKAAIRRFDEAISLAGVAGDTERILAAEFGRGQALYGLQQYAEASANLQTVVEADTTQRYPEAWLYLGLVHARRHDYAAAAHTLQSFVTYYPQSAQRAWVEQYIGWLQSGGSGEKYALLIGINAYPHAPIRQTGCINDVNLMKQVLIHLGFPEPNIIILVDAAATCAGILAAMDEMAGKTRSTDTVVIHYSGFSRPEAQIAHTSASPDDAYLFTYDIMCTGDDWSGPLQNGISSSALHCRMQAIAAMHKTLILDTHVRTTLVRLAETDGDYALLMAAAPGEPCYERVVELDGKPVIAGLFTAMLTLQLARLDPKTVTYDQLIDATAKAMSGAAQATANTLSDHPVAQTPCLIGANDQLVFAPGDMYAELFDFAHQGLHPAPTVPELTRSYQRFQAHIAALFPEVHLGFGRAFSEKHAYDAAIAALEVAIQERPQHVVALLALARAQIAARYDAPAMRTVDRYTETAPSSPRVPRLRECTRALADGQKYALVVGVDHYPGYPGAPVGGARNDAEAMASALQARFGFQPANIRLLLNQDATRDAIMGGFADLARRAETAPALFYFAGCGSFTSENMPTLVSADGRQEGVYDIEMAELAQIAPASLANFVTIIDAGWTDKVKFGSGSRTIPGDTRVKLSERNLKPAEPRPRRKAVRSDEIAVGAVCIYAQSTTSDFEGAPPNLERKSDPADGVAKPCGRLTGALLASLAGADIAQLTFDGWVAGAKQRMPDLRPTCLGDGLPGLAFDNRAMREEALTLITWIEEAPIQETIELLSRSIERRAQQGDPCPEAKLNRGVAYIATRQFDKAIADLTASAACLGGTSSAPDDQVLQAWAPSGLPEARYQLGRAYYLRGQKGDYTSAVDELRAATDARCSAPDNDPTKARAYLYLGQAVRAMIAHETLGEAEQALEQYLDLGAPLGEAEDVRAFLASRQADQNDAGLGLFAIPVDREQP